MKYDFLLYFPVQIALFLLLCTACSNDNEPVEPPVEAEYIQRLKSIEYPGSTINSEKLLVTLEYDDLNRLIKMVEGYAEEVITTLTYNNTEVTVERMGSYYGKYTLNEQGHADSFERKSPPAYVYTYSADGYLIEAGSRNDEEKQGYTYFSNSFSSCTVPGNEYTFTASTVKDPQNTPSLYQPRYLHIPGNAEVTIGYLAGLYGKPCEYLMESANLIINKDLDWESKQVITYAYEFNEEGLVAKQTESGEYYQKRNGTFRFKNSWNNDILFTYESVRIN
ncbi:DUF4595 domain-containing protein [Bacteroides sp. OttesenSCG-928-F21]|nr:DUF4595 domain-containing protein [Bacteroides sp. OttesenSCG-928-F21]